MEGGTGSTLALTGREVEDAGDYHVVVSNAGGEATSETASLTVELPPTITGLTESAGGGVDLTAKAVVGPELVTYEWSQNGTWAVGDPFGLTATVTGAKPISYEWYFDGQLIDGATYNHMVLVKLSV